jgi:hypothetical protein
MTRTRIAGAMLLVLLGAGVLTRVTNRAGLSPKNPANVPLEIPTGQTQPVIEAVDLRNGNLHVEIPIRAARQKLLPRYLINEQSSCPGRSWAAVACDPGVGEVPGERFFL